MIRIQGPCLDRSEKQHNFIVNCRCQMAQVVQTLRCRCWDNMHNVGTLQLRSCQWHHCQDGITARQLIMQMMICLHNCLQNLTVPSNQVCVQVAFRRSELVHQSVADAISGYAVLLRPLRLVKNAAKPLLVSCCSCHPMLCSALKQELKLLALRIMTYCDECRHDSAFQFQLATPSANLEP